MNEIVPLWVLASFVTLICFSGCGLGYRRLAELKIPSPVFLGINFGLGAACFLARILWSGEAVPPLQMWLGLTWMAIVCSYGNVLQAKAIHRAPNPGFAVALVGCQSPIIAVISVFLFHDSLNPWKFAALVSSLTGVAVLAYEPKRTGEPVKGNEWLIPGIITMVMTGSNTLMYRFLGSHGVGLNWINFVMMGGATAFLILGWFGNRASYSVSRTSFGRTAIIWLAIFVFGSTLGSSLQAWAYNHAPNTGYPIGIISCDAMVVTLVGAFAYGHRVNLRQWAGTALCFLGLLVIAFVGH